MFAMPVRCLSLAFLLVVATGPDVLAAEETPPPAIGNERAPLHKWDNETFERRAFREEMQQIRHEHEDLESERIALQAHCAQKDAPTCALEKQSLQERRTKLHERVANLREKIEAVRRGDKEHSQDQERAPDTLTPPK